MLKFLHFSDLHLGSGLNQGKINPQSGLNSRLEDFLKSLRGCIDRAVKESADLVLFAGDAFPDATPPPYIQDYFAQQIQRLVTAQIPVVLLVGNHDQHRQGEGGASLSLYRTLQIPGVTVGDRLETHRILTPSGPVQVITLPWLTASALFTRPEMADLPLSEVRRQLLDRLSLALEAEIRQLDPHIPTILLAHAMVDTAQYGAERFLAVGKGFTVPLSLLARPCFDYVALGHVHRHQILCTDPLVVYSGSVERVDFSEEREEKGYVWGEITSSGERTTRITFVPLATRPFLSVSCDLSDCADPQTTVLATIAAAPIDNAIVRLRYKLQPHQIGSIDEGALHAALEPAHHYHIQAQISRTSTLEPLEQWSEGTSPLDTLTAYLDRREELQPWRSDLLRAAESLLEGWDPDLSLTAGHLGESGAVYHPDQGDRQLTLL